MPTSSDLEMNRRIRRILVKHWIDLGRLSIRTMRGVVVLYGRLQRIPGRDALIPAIVEAIFYEIKRIKGVKWIRAHLDNWTNDGGLWHPRKGTEGDLPDRKDGRRHGH